MSVNINIVASGSNEINNQYIFQLLKKRDKTKNHVIISPDRSQFSIERRLFDETGEVCFFDINVISLTRLARKTLGVSRKKILTKQSGIALVKKIITDNRDKLLAFGKATDYVGFASTLFETICFYKSCNISPVDIYTDDSESYSNYKQKDIKFVYSEYEKFLEEEYTDSFNQLKLFADSIDSDTFRNTVFYFLEFDDFTRLMYEIILKLSRFSDGIYISCLRGGSANNSHLYNNKVYNDLIEMYRYNNMLFEIKKVDQVLDNPQSVLLSNVLAFSPDKIDLSSSGVEIREFDSLDDEVEFCVSDIYNRLKNGGEETLSDYALVVPSLSDYKSKIERCMVACGLPYYFDESKKLSVHPLVRIIFDILNLLGHNYSLSEFQVVIKSPLLNLDKIAVRCLDKHLIRIGAIGDMCISLDGIEDEGLLELLNLIIDLKSKARESKTFGDYIDIVNLAFEYILSRSGEYESTLDDLELRVWEQAKNKINSINEDMVAVFGSIDINAENFVDIYKEYYDSTNISLPPITSNTLFVADINASYVSKYKHLYVLGNNDGKMPSQKLDNGLITDDEMARLPNANLLSPTIAMLNARKVLKVVDLLSRYEKDIILSYPTSNGEGNLFANNLINSLIKIGDIKVKRYSGALDVIASNYYDMSTDNVLFNHQNLRCLESKLIDYLGQWETYNSNTNYRKLCSTLYQLSSADVKSLIAGMGHKKSLGAVKGDFFHNNATSVSQIEMYYKCPYMHFARYGLLLKDDIDTTLKPNDIGTIIHDVLSKLVPYILKHKEDLSDLNSKAHELLDYVIKKEEYKDTISNKNNAYVIRALYDEVGRIANAVASPILKCNFEPKYYEYRFDNIPSANGLSIRGFVDRIDIKDDGFVVIDYKTGDNHFDDYSDLASGKKLQLLVYARAFEKISGLRCKGVFYFPISNDFGGTYRLNGTMIREESNLIDMDTNLIRDGYKSDTINIQKTSKGKIRESQYYKNMCIDSDDMDYIINYAINKVEEAVIRIISGQIDPNPLREGDKIVCDYCKFRAMCCNENNCNDQKIIKTISELKEEV